MSGSDSGASSADPGEGKDLPAALREWAGCVVTAFDGESRLVYVDEDYERVLRAAADEIERLRFRVSQLAHAASGLNDPLNAQRKKI